MLINEFQGQASVAIEAEPDDVFATITAIDRLPEWNARITAVLEPPADPSLPTGTEWVVQMTVPPARWPSRSRVVTCDPALRSFEHVREATTVTPAMSCGVGQCRPICRERWSRSSGTST